MNATTTPLLQVHSLVKRFGGLTATDHASFDVHAGEIHALIGPNGAGKTTLIHQLSGALASDEGQIRFAGAVINGLAMPARVQHGLVRSYQITSIFKRLTVLENIAMAVQARDGSSWRFWQAARNETARYAQAAEVAERVGLAAQIHQPAGLLAHGEQRQLEVGLALATQPRMLLLDEPMAGMGPEESESMVRLLLQLRQDTTILLVELGGIGSIRGALLGALLVGVVDTAGRTVVPLLFEKTMGPDVAANAGPAVASILIYVLMAAVLFYKPQGLFPAHD